MRSRLFALALLAGITAAPSTAEPVPPRYPASAFGQLPALKDPTLSPDGNHIAALVAVDGRQMLAIKSVAGDGALAMAAVEQGEIRWFRWASNDRLLVSLAQRQTIPGQRGTYTITRLISLDTQGRNMVKLGWHSTAQYGDRLLYTDPRGSNSILLGNSPTVYSDLAPQPPVERVDVTTGKTETVVAANSQVGRWFVDSSGVVRIGVGYFSDHWDFIYRSKDGEPFTKNARVDFPEGKSAFVPIPEFLPPGSDIAVVSSDRGGRSALYDYDMKAASFGQIVYGDPRYDVDTVIVAPDRSHVSGVRLTDTREHNVWLDEEMKTFQAQLDASVAPLNADIVSSDAEQLRFIVHVGGSATPGRFYIIDRREGTLKSLARVNEALKGAVLAPMVAVTYRARDGLDIPAYLTLPVGRPAKGLPLIVMPHGGPWVRDQLEYDHWVQFLANRGYAVLQPNYRGSTGYGIAFRDAGDGEWGLKMQDDVTDGVAWLVADGRVDPKRVCIMGGSYGGYAAMQGVIRDPDLYRCAISFAGVSDMATQVAYDRDYLGSDPRRQLKRAAPDFVAISPLHHVDRIKTPILLIHGGADITVPIVQSDQMARALKAAGKTYDYVVQPQATHYLTHQADRIQLLEVTEAFLAKYNPAD